MKSYYRHDYGANQRSYHRARRRRLLLAAAKRGSGALAAAAVLALGAAAWSSLGPGALGAQFGSLRVLRLEEIVVSGAATLTRAEVLAAAGVQSGCSLVGLDLEAARTRLAAHPRVRSATLRRRLPGTLFVEVAERVPCAVVRADRDLLVDAEGVVVGPAAAGGEGLPVLTGVETAGGALTARGADDLAAGLALVAAIREVGFPALTAVAHIDLADPDDAVIVPVAGRPIVHAGRENAALRLARWRLVAPDMARRWAEVEYVDLRAEGQVVALPAAAEPESPALGGAKDGKDAQAAQPPAAAAPAKAPGRTPAKAPAAGRKGAAPARATSGGGHA